MYINIGKLAIFLSLSALLVPLLSLQGLAIANIAAAIFALLLTIFLVKINQTNQIRN